ncbi:MAG TPA: hypothetical protein P5267_03780 [Patescibacteria group bacterium]|nr:hypothetical protein [Patescibacteria group bacterium]
MNSFEKQIINIFTRVGEIFNLHDYTFRTMKRVVDDEGRGVLNLKKSYRLAYINLKKKEITIDVYTPRFRKEKSIPAILKILAHEIAHTQKLPFRQFYRFRWITRQHYPEFYQQVGENIEKMKADVILRTYWV